MCSQYASNYSTLPPHCSNDYNVIMPCGGLLGDNPFGGALRSSAGRWIERLAIHGSESASIYQEIDKHEAMSPYACEASSIDET